MIERQLQPGANGPRRGAFTRESCLRTMETMRLCLMVPASTLEPLGPHEPPAARNLSQKPPSSIAACSSFDIGAPAASDLVQQLQPPAREPHQQWPAIPDTVKAKLNMGHQHHFDNDYRCEEENSSCQCAGTCSSSGHPPLADGFGNDHRAPSHEHMPRRVPKVAGNQERLAARHGLDQLGCPHVHEAVPAGMVKFEWARCRTFPRSPHYTPGVRDRQPCTSGPWATDGAAGSIPKWAGPLARSES